MAGASPDSARPDSNGKARSPATPQQIRCRAYEIYCGRNGGAGDALSDWLAAERELCGTPAATAADESERLREIAMLSPREGDPMC